MSVLATPDQVWDVIVWWHGDATNPMESDLRDTSYLSNHYIPQIPSSVGNLYTCLTKWLISMEKLVSGSVIRDCLATTMLPGLIAQYHSVLEQ
jgi:hypothetical protein